MDESIQKEHRDLSFKFRESDTFFADCNTVIWNTLQKIYPEFGHLVVYITREELD